MVEENSGMALFAVCAGGDMAIILDQQYSDFSNVSTQPLCADTQSATRKDYLPSWMPTVEWEPRH